MSLNMKSLTQALAKTAAAIEKTVQSTVQEVTGPKALQDYELLDQVGSGGPGLAWKLYLGKPRNRAAQAHHPEVCVWLLDKKSLADARLRVGISKAAEGAFVDVIKADAAQMMRLRHPGIVRVVEGLDESKGVMVMVTEPIFASVANLLGDMENVQKIPKELNGLELGQLEIKHGLLQLADSLAFLHNNARIVHRAISPEAIFVTSSGAWKLGGFGHALNLDHVGVEADAGPAYHYPDYDVEDIVMPLQPQLDYTAPELTRSQSTPRTTSDIFSLACLAYHLLARKPLIKSKNNLRTYTSKVTYLMNENFLGLPSELVPDIRRMLNPDEMSRPSALDFTGSPFFRDDVRLRALRFLDHMLETDNVQKADFLKALGKMWTDFDSRILRYKVLPPLCAELRNQVMQPMVLPMVLTIAEAQDKSDFELSTFPALLPVLTTATGDSLLLLVKHAALLIKQVSPEQLIGCVIPMLVRAYDDPDARIQEEVLRRTLSFSRELDFPVLTQSILPRVHALALKTTVAAVRVNALLCLGKLVHQLDKPAVIDVLQTLKSCTAVDHSAPTLMCTLEVASSIYKQFGIEFAVDQLLPLLTPLLIAQQLNIEQFGKYMLFVKEILRKIEEKRGVPPNENEVMTSNSLSAFQGEINGRRTTVNGRGSSLPDKGIYRNWDDDYWSSARSLKAESSSNKSVADTKISDSMSSSSRPAVSTSAALITSLPTSRSYNTSVASYSTPTLEWPPPSIRPANVQSLSTISGNMPSADGGKDINTPIYTVNSNIFLNPTSISDGSDPFADWPPSRHSSANNLDQSKEKTKDPYVFSGLNRPELVTSDSKSLQEDRIDVASFFSSTSPLQPQPSTFRIAPPPSTGLGKGKGRNPIRPIGSANQPSTLDLL